MLANNQFIYVIKTNTNRRPESFTILFQQRMLPYASQYIYVVLKSNTSSNMRPVCRSRRGA